MSKVMRQITVLLVMFALLVSLTSCAGSTTATTAAATTKATSAATTTAVQTTKKVDFPTKGITLIVPFAAGGGTDTGARLMAAEVEKILKVPVTVVNKAGASGWLGWTELLAAKADGYTIAHFNDIDVIAGYLDKQQNRKNTVDDFAPIYCYVADPQIIAINVSDKRFTTIEELITYAKTHEVTVAIPGNPSFIAMTKINSQLGTKFLAVRNKGAAESLPAVMGGHVDVMLNTVGETTVPAKAGQIKPLAVLSKERSNFLPDVRTFKEAMNSEIVSASVRGYAAPKGVDPAVLNVLISAFEQGAKAETFKTKMAEQGLATVSMSGDTYKAFIKAEESSVKSILPLLGWN